MNREMKDQVKEEWRMFGFYYDTDTANKKWIFIGSKLGLEQFSIYIHRFLNSGTRMFTSQHDHLGPYGYLKIMVYDPPNITENHICGSIQELERLGELIEKRIKESKPGDIFTIRDEYYESCEFSLEFRVKEYGFDPATADGILWVDEDSV